MSSTDEPSRPAWRALPLLAFVAIIVSGVTLAVHWSSGESLSIDPQSEQAGAEDQVGPRDGESGALAPRVAMLGDSIVFVSTPTLRDQIGAKYRIHIEAQVGATVGAMLQEVPRMVERNPDQVVIDLGTNDAIFGTTLSDAMRHYEEVVATFHDADVDCIHLVNLNTGMGKLDPRINERAQQFNEFIDALGKRPDVEVIDWDGMLALAADDPASAPFLSDTVHPTEDGSRVLAWLVENSLDRGCP